MTARDAGGTPYLTTVEDVADLIAQQAASVSRLIVGLAGEPGSGKSTAAGQIVGLLGSSAQLLAMDGFHLPQARLVELGRRDRMGAPDTFDVDGLVSVLRRLREGGRADAPGFDRVIEEPIPGAITIVAETRTVLVEGNYLLHDGDGWQASAPLFDVRLYLDIDQALRRERLVARHIRFGKSPDAARAWTLGPDEANARLIAATAVRADHIVRLE